MQLGSDSFFHLTYCTNIHPGHGWSEVFANLQHYAPALKHRLSPDQRFGIGLRLSATESDQLLQESHLDQFKAFLDSHDFYVAILNGFPFGSFHREKIKEEVFAPDWRTEERVQYTLRLIEILGHLLPEGLDGGISTSPLSYKRWIASEDRTAWETMTRNLVRVATAMMRVRQEKGKLLHLDIEPEPDGLLENSAEVVAFYETWLLPIGAPLLADTLQISLEQARHSLLEHLQICLDTCHMAVEYEDPFSVLERFQQADIRVGRVQVSSALKVILPEDRKQRLLLAQQLEPFAESTYLHQVIEQREGGTFYRYADLIEALPKLQESPGQQWRIHFHVPLFIEQYGTFFSTQQEIHPVFTLLQKTRFTRHLEIETYTWEVLPPDLKQELVESIDREYRWVLETFAKPLEQRIHA